MKFNQLLIGPAPQHLSAVWRGLIMSSEEQRPISLFLTGALRREALPQDNLIDASTTEIVTAVVFLLVCVCVFVFF